MKKIIAIIIIALLVLGIFIYVYVSTEKSDSKESDSKETDDWSANEEWDKVKVILKTNHSTYPQGTNVNISYTIKNNMDFNITPDKYVIVISNVLIKDYDPVGGGAYSIIGYIKSLIPKGEIYTGTMVWKTKYSEQGEYYIIFTIGEILEETELGPLTQPMKKVKIEVTIT